MLKNFLVVAMLVGVYGCDKKAELSQVESDFITRLDDRRVVFGDTEMSLDDMISYWNNLVQLNIVVRPSARRDQMVQLKKKHDRAGKTLSSICKEAGCDWSIMPVNGYTVIVIGTADDLDSLGDRSRIEASLKRFKK